MTGEQSEAPPVIAWFRNDLRLEDNAALGAAVAAGSPVLPLYILDHETPGTWKPGAASRWWLERTLAALGTSLQRIGSRLVLRRGGSLDVLRDIFTSVRPKAIYFSRDHAPWSEALEQSVKALCDEHGIGCHRHAGYLLHDPAGIRTGGGEPYKVYAPFSRACSAAVPDRTPLPAPDRLVTPATLPASDRLEDWGLYDAKPDWARNFPHHWAPGEAGARASLEQFVESALARYALDRDRPALDGTSRLSPHLHFGEISPRTCWSAARSRMARAGGKTDKGGEVFLKELMWREFSYHLLHYWPDLPDEPFRPEFSGLDWRDDRSGLAAWREGRTGYPIVDAGMRQLWRTGWMHNRVRMVAASFLTKHLLIPWQEGEKWFWDTLVDADLASNAASWQWVAGSGADAAPYFRIFNPVLQGEKFDPEGDYVRRFVPELAAMPAAFIHKPWLASDAVLGSAGVRLGDTYPRPIVDHGEARKRALAAYQQMKDGQ